MATQIFTNISFLGNIREKRGFVRGKELALLPSEENAYLIIGDQIIAELGKMEDCIFTKESNAIPRNTIILPSGCDQPHTLSFCTKP